MASDRSGMTPLQELASYAAADRIDKPGEYLRLARLAVCHVAELVRDDDDLPPGVRYKLLSLDPRGLDVLARLLAFAENDVLAELAERDRVLAESGQEAPPPTVEPRRLGEAITYREWEIGPSLIRAGWWDASHRNYDGAPDAHDDRCVMNCKSVEEVKREIDQWYAEQDDDLDLHAEEPTPPYSHRQRGVDVHASAGEVGNV